MKTKYGFQIIIAIFVVMTSIGCSTTNVFIQPASTRQPEFVWFGDRLFEEDKTHVKVRDVGYHGPDCLRFDPESQDAAKACLGYETRGTYEGIVRAKEDGYWFDIDKAMIRVELVPTGVAWYPISQVEIIPASWIIATVTPDPTRTPTPLPTRGCFKHFVQTGETLYSLAKQNDTTVSVLQKDNGISNPNFVRASQLLNICPGKK